MADRETKRRPKIDRGDILFWAGYLALITIGAWLLTLNGRTPYWVALLVLLFIAAVSGLWGVASVRRARLNRNN